MSSLLDTIVSYLPEGALGAAATELGEDVESVSKGLGSLLPTLLAGMIDKIEAPEGLSYLFSSLSDERNVGFLDQLSSLVGSANLAQNDPKDIAGALVGNLFGAKVGPILQSVSSLAGLKFPGSASNLLGLAGPLIMGVLGKKIADTGMNALGLANLLKGQRNEIAAALPPQIASLIDFERNEPESGGVAAAVAGVGAAAGTVAAGAVETVGGVAGSAADGVGAAAGAVADVTGDAVEGVADAAGAVTAAAGAAALGAAGAVTGAASAVTGSVGETVSNAKKGHVEGSGLGWLWFVLIFAALASLPFWLGKVVPAVPVIELPTLEEAVSEAPEIAVEAPTADIAIEAADVDVDVDIAIDADNVAGTDADVEGALDAASDTAEGVDTASGDASTVNLAQAEEFVEKIGDFEIKGAADGVEAKLLGFIKDNTDPCTDKECWFTMDRLVFQTGSSDLDMNFSADQLNNVYQIMSAYPNIQLKVGGYTDNTGSEDLNLRLSKQRADTVVSALVALGLEEDRFNAEGFGPAHPIATNDTPEGRAQNRRIDVRVRSNTFGEE